MEQEDGLNVFGSDLFMVALILYVVVALSACSSCQDTTPLSYRLCH